MGKNPYRSILQLWEEKTGKLPVTDEGNEYTYWGNVMEPIIRKEFMNRTGAITLEDNKIKVDESKCNYCGRCVKACPTDAWDAKSGYLVSFGGLFGNRIYKGEEILPVIESEEDLFRVTDAAIQFFDDNANPSERFRFTIERVGEDKFIEKMKEAYHG